METIGPYRILGVVGSGGMGIVYRGRHAETGEEVAVKTVRLTRGGHLSGLRREIRALERLRHPNVVRVLESGVHEGAPWYAMELLEGTTLRDLIRRGRVTTPAPVSATVVEPLTPDDDVPDAPPATARELELRAALTLARRLCDPLAYIHGEGIVHRDLKPGNVFVLTDGRPVLVDFGLALESAAGVSRETLAESWETSGTILYMAPEQIDGDLVDARTDLYALGCVLYELVTGRPPFAGPSSAILLAHIRDTPPPPSCVAPGVPAELDELVARMLAKRPRDRVGHAGVVAAALERMGAEPPEGYDPPRPRAYLYRPGFSGRTAPLDDLERYLMRSLDGRGGVLFVGGESGVGKTRFAIEAARRARALGIRVLAGECEPLEPGAEPAAAHPLGAFRRPLEAVAPERSDEARWRVLAPYVSPSAAVEPAPDLPVEAALARLYDALAHVLAPVGGEPCLLVLDDLQWADELTLGFLAHAIESRRLERDGLLVVALYRSEEASGALARLVASPAAGRLSLDRLDGGAVASIVGDMLALDPAPAVLGDLVSRQSEGNPFFVAEYLRAAVDERLLARDAAGDWRVREQAIRELSAADADRLAMPGSVRELCMRRLGALSAAALAVVRAAAVVGRETAFEWLDPMTALGDGAILDAVDEALRRRIFEEPRPGVLRFSHDKLREAAYETIAAGELPGLHRAAAEALESAGAVEDPGALGLHWERAGEAGRARAWHLEAARLAMSRYALDEAERSYRAFLALGGSSADDVSARNDLGDMLRLSGRVADAARELALALEGARALGDVEGEWRALHGLGTVRFALGEHDEAETHYGEALALARRGGDRHKEGAMLGRLAVFHHERSQPAEAEALYERAIEIHREFGDRRGEAVLLGNLANLRFDVGMPDAAHDLYAHALALHREVGDEIGEGRVLGNLATLGCSRDRFDEALGLYEQALAVHRRTGNLRDEAICLLNLASLHMHEGRPEEARALYSRALELHRAMGSRRYAAVALAALGMIERRTGDLDAAARLLEEAERDLLEVGDRLYAAIYRAALGHVALARGEDARPVLEEVRRTAADLAARDESEIAIAIRSLEGAVEASRAGEPLYRGERPETIPDGLRRWLADRGQL
jgi:serine/threonine protein kinase/tetratricopeptide (TPR) repeat protein